MGGVRCLPRRGAPAGFVPPVIPAPVRLMERFATLPDEYLGTDWYVVFKGKTPGVFPSWYVNLFNSNVLVLIFICRGFTATQVTGVATSTFQKY